VQIPQMQFFKGKSYQGFCPIGPYLAVLEREEFAYLDQPTLTLTVNGQLRQQDETRNLADKSAETITELSTFSDISAGDAARARRVAAAPILRPTPPQMGPATAQDNCR
jgi:2-keto-4-pentenoate hydratase/2-oxohepta-3-ene-1,7-dioic acid hydratase in catechol pathway